MKFCPDLETIQENSKWNLISMEWFIKFTQYHGFWIKGYENRYDDDSSKPGQIKNTGLLNLDQKLYLDGSDSQTYRWSQTAMILKTGLRLGIDFIIVYPRMFNILSNKYGVDYPISRYWVKNPSCKPDWSSPNISLELYLPKLKILQIPKDCDSDDDFEYMLIPQDKYSKTVSEDEQTHELFISAEYIWKQIHNYKASNFSLWKVKQKYDNYQDCYDYYEKQITGKNIANDKMIEIYQYSTRQVKFLEDEMLLIHIENCKFLHSSSQKFLI